MYCEIILQLIREFQRDFQRKLQHSITKTILNVRFNFANSGHVKWIDCKKTATRIISPQDLSPPQRSLSSFR